MENESEAEIFSWFAWLSLQLFASRVARRAALSVSIGAIGVGHLPRSPSSAVVVDGRGLYGRFGYERGATTQKGSASEQRGLTSLGLFKDYRWRTPVATNPTRICQLLVGAPDLTVLATTDDVGSVRC